MNDSQKLAEMIRDIKITMLTTVDANGVLRSRPMATQELNTLAFEGCLWFFTNKESLKVHQIQQDQHVNLTYTNPDKQRYVSVSGKATLSEDRGLMEILWRPFYKAWFPEGLEDPGLILIGVDVESAEFWDAPQSKMVQMLGIVKAAISGDVYHAKESNKELNLNHH